MERMSKRGLIGVSGVVSLVVLSFALGGSIFPPASLASTARLLAPNDPFEVAIREIQRIEPAYLAAQAEVKEATRQISSFLPMALEPSEPFQQKMQDMVAALGMKKAPMRETGSGLRFEMITLRHKAATVEPARDSKGFFKILRE